MKVIGLHGARGSGKDSIVAARLCEHWGFEAFAFADAIRIGLAEMFEPLGFGMEFFEDRSRKELPTPALNGRSPRMAMQTLGDWGRHWMGADVWIRILDGQIRAVESWGGLDRIVITDVRMENEAEWVKNVMGGQIWLVQRPGERFRHDHGSEFELPTKYIDRGILNDQTELEVWARIDKLMEEVL